MRLLFLIITLLFNYYEVFSQQQISNTQIEVAFFFSIDCPITQKYMSKVNDIVKRYNAGQPSKFKFIAYFPNRVTRNQLSAFRKMYQVPNSLVFVKDFNHKKVKMFGASTTPEVYVLNHSNLIYSGAIDNWFYSLGRYRATITEHYLVNALDSALNGLTPKVCRTEPIGCFIEK